MKEISEDKTDNKRKISIFLIVYLFLFMFAPPILPVNINLIIPLAFFSFVVLIRKYRDFFSKAIVLSSMGRFSVFIYLYLLYTVLIGLVGLLWGERESFSAYITPYYQIFLLTPIMMICILHIILWCERLDFSLDDLLIHFIWAGMIEAVLVIFCYFSPQIRHFFVQLMSRKINFESEAYKNFILARRFYGFANGLYDQFGWGTGLLAALPFFLSERKRRKYIALVPFLILSPTMNSRTGLLMFILGLLIYFVFMDTKNVFWVLKKFFYIILIGALLYLLFILVVKKNDIMYQWILSGWDYFQKSISNGVDSPIRMRWIPPEFPVILFGTGHNIYNSAYRHSDLGYINYLYIGGIAGSLILYGILVNYFMKAWRLTGDKREKLLLLFLAISFFAFNFKGMALSHCPATALIFAVLFFILYINRKKTKGNFLNNNFIR